MACQGLGLLGMTVSLKMITDFSSSGPSLSYLSGICILVGFPKALGVRHDVLPTLVVAEALRH